LKASKPSTLKINKKFQNKPSTSPNLQPLKHKTNCDRILFLLMHPPPPSCILLLLMHHPPPHSAWTLNDCAAEELL
jgi:hypothetical protein